MASLKIYIPSTIALLFWASIGIAAPKDTLHGKTYKSATKKLHRAMWTTPVAKSTRIDGVALGFAAIPERPEDSLEINGLNVDFDPIPVIATPMMGLYLIISVFSRKDDKFKPLAKNLFAFPTHDSAITTEFNGVGLSTGIIANARAHGLFINALFAIENELKGLEVTGLVNMHQHFSGVLLAGLLNKTTQGRGLQIGLINNCKEGRLVQIGLVNKIGKRTVPFVNFSFKRKIKPLLQ